MKGELRCIELRIFFTKTVYDIKGKKLGSVRDIFIDFYKGKVMGLSVGSYSLRLKNNYTPIDKI